MKELTIAATVENIETVTDFVNEVGAIMLEKYKDYR